MRKIIQLGVILAAFISSTALAQNGAPLINRLKVFIDCNNARCDMTFIRTEINLVDFMLDRQAADVHVLVTQQGTGGGGSQYQIIFFGQNQFRQLSDTIRFNIEPNATEFESRDIMIKYLKLGLTRYIVKTKAGKDIVIQMKRSEEDIKADKKDSSGTTKDPWNYWVYQVGVNGFFLADANYKNSNYSGELSANRVTEELKIGVELSANRSKETTYENADSAGNRPKTITNRDNYEFQHWLIKSMGPRWSVGYEVIFSRNTFSNNKSRAFFRTGVEYAIFPYKLVNTKFFTVSYTVDARRNNYFDTTLLDKTKETLFGHGVESDLSFKQKWGSISFGLEYHNYLHNWKFFSLGAHLELDIRVTGGLSIFFFSQAELTHDQLFLIKDEADLRDILTRRRQLASGYNFATHFGISYRFGSKLNNFVNPRFD